MNLNLLITTSYNIVLYDTAFDITRVIAIYIDPKWSLKTDF